MKYTITQTETGWLLDQEDGETRWPQTHKATAREVIARLMQLMDVGPVAPQLEPERVCIGGET